MEIVETPLDPMFSTTAKLLLAHTHFFIPGSELNTNMVIFRGGSLSVGRQAPLDEVATGPGAKPAVHIKEEYYKVVSSMAASHVLTMYTILAERTLDNSSQNQ